MDVSKSLNQLADEIKQNQLILGEPSGRNEKYLKKDYVKVLSRYYLEQRYGSVKDMPVNMKFRFSFDSPQLAEQYSKLKPEEQENVWDSEGIWLVEKIRGVRATMVLSPKEGLSLFPREISSEDYIFPNYAHRLNLPVDEGSIKYPVAVDLEIVLADNKIIQFLDGLGVDVEGEEYAITKLMYLDTELWNQVEKEFGVVFQFRLLDVYHWGGKDIRKETYEMRESYFDDVVKFLNALGYPVKRPWICKDPDQKKAFHEGIIERGGEGTIAVNIDKPCNLTGRRRRDEWVKIKRSLFNLDENALDDTVDCVIQEVQYHKAMKELVESVKVSLIDENVDYKVTTEIRHIPLSIRTNKYLKKGIACEVSGRRVMNGVIEDPVIESLRLDR